MKTGKSSLAFVARLAVWAFLAFVMAEAPLGGGELYGSPEQTRRELRLSAWTGDLPPRLARAEEALRSSSTLELSNLDPHCLLFYEGSEQPAIVPVSGGDRFSPAAPARAAAPAVDLCSRAAPGLRARAPPPLA